MKKNMLKITIIAISLFLLAYIVPRFFGYIGGIIYSLQLDLPQEYAKKSTDWLLKEMDSFNWRSADVAYGVLMDRKEKRAVPKIIEKIKRDPGNAAMYVQALARIGDPSAVPSILEVIKEQKDKTPANDIYEKSVVALAELKYQGIWSTLVNLAQSNKEEDMALAVRGMQAYGSKEALPYLNNISEKYSSGEFLPCYEIEDKGKIRVYVLSLKKINDAIEYVEKENK